ncbi:hypothetical protein FRB94_012848 [Tulasnella sp. JGI-2019a]|nr:hypothetical protein FRB94_012848 [Tulasnella sp. JGI-2019a]
MISMLSQSIDHLEQLLRGLPETLPCDLEDSLYPVALDGELASQEGDYVALNAALHCSVGHHTNGITFLEWGNNVMSIIPALQFTTVDKQSEDLIQKWVDDLTDAAMAASAMEVALTTKQRKHASECIEISDDDNEAQVDEPNESSDPSKPPEKKKADKLVDKLLVKAGPGTQVACVSCWCVTASRN